MTPHDEKPRPATARGELNHQPHASIAPPPRQDGPPGNGWFRCWRNPDAIELWRKHRPAFFLLWLIAHRARWRDGFNAHGLERGQAFIGKMDCEAHGISEQEYRTAKRILQEAGFATFKPTNQGTIATLINTGIFDPFTVQGNEPANERVTSGQRAGNERVTPNEDLNKGKIGKTGQDGAFAAAARRESAPTRDDVSNFISLWETAYRETFGQPYVCTAKAKDYKAAERLLVEAGKHFSDAKPETLVRVARRAWNALQAGYDNADIFNCRKATSIPGFVSNFSDVLRELKELGL